jgi:hypothetical protein
MHRLVLLVLASAAAGAAGCFVAVPSVARCPGAPVPAGDDVVAVTVRAKRVQHGTAPVPEESHTLHLVALRDGAVPGQVRPSVTHGLPVLGSVHSEYLMTKLYRRGYKTVILDGHESPPRVEWVPASTPDEREAAVRELVYYARPGYARAPVPALPPGSSDPRHREALTFAAHEFELVAELYPDGSKDRARSREQAAVLRARAAE